MTHQGDFSTVPEILELFAEEGQDGMAQAMTVLVNEAMKLQRAKFLKAKPHERTSNRLGYANGFKPRSLESRLGKLALRVPQVRGQVDGETFYPNVLERGERSERALKLALAEMYVQGVSTRKVTAIVQELCGFEVTSTQVSRAAAELDTLLESWRTRPLGQMDYIILDARYEKVRHGGHVVSSAVLTAIGIDPEGRRSVLGTSVSLSEAEVHWRAFLTSLRERGLFGLKLAVSDDHDGLKKALVASFPGIPWQRCQVHLQRNATKYIPHMDLKAPVAADLRQIFTAPSREEAEAKLVRVLEKYKKQAPKLVAWMEKAVPEGFSVFALPEPHRARLRSTNLLEWLNKELKRRTSVATLFPNEASLLRLVSAILMEVSEEWESAKRYLPKELK